MDFNRRAIRGVLSCIFVGFVVLNQVCCIEVNTPAEISAVRGSTVTLSCTFISSIRITSRMSVDWSFTPQSGGPAKMFFHFSSQVYPPVEDHFKGRVKWVGRPSRGEASIELLNASLTDNGTYTCAVRNPPDVQGRPAHIVLTVTPKRVSVAFTDVAVLLAFVLVPSALVSLLLLGRTVCPCWAVSESRAATHHSPIEVITGDEDFYKQPLQKENLSCCYFKDSDYEDDYILHDKPHEHESRC
ncbi:myelin protein zero-like protein 3 [Myxocyprinus asiaticus]|uniref:myelin protein zero-like protein 3 n=1 Tax=Myxocyprinus asiaticus TaxID=70543 RepID=UPI002221DF39|nr:myelin protein zero-like protein 3 [Myxocyprinus asiaticus]